MGNKLVDKFRRAMVSFKSLADGTGQIRGLLLGAVLPHTVQVKAVRVKELEVALGTRIEALGHGHRRVEHGIALRVVQGKDLLVGLEGDVSIIRTQLHWDHPPPYLVLLHEVQLEHFHV